MNDTLSAQSEPYTTLANKTPSTHSSRRFERVIHSSRSKVEPVVRCLQLAAIRPTTALGDRCRMYLATIQLSKSLRARQIYRVSNRLQDPFSDFFSVGSHTPKTAQKRGFRPKSARQTFDRRPPRKPSPANFRDPPRQPCLARGEPITGAERARTANLLVANQALSQLSYGPV